MTQPTAPNPSAPPLRPPPRRASLALALLAAVAVAGAAGGALHARAADDAKPAAARPALTVSVVRPQPTVVPRAVDAAGSVAAWQEASVGAEAGGLRIAEVRVNVGDVVRRGQVLATFNADLLRADLLQQQAGVAEAEATAAEAAANAARARTLQASGALSEQQIAQYLTAERTAQARLAAQRALLEVQRLKLAQSTLTAPDAGVISARSATVGAVVPAGQELFRLIRQGRLEWRAEVAAAELALLRPGQPVTLQATVGAPPVAGRVRMVGPTVDAATRNGLVYVDLAPAGGGAAPSPVKAGMFARGSIEVGRASASTLPQPAVLLRDGFAWVFLVDRESRVRQQKVEVGARVGDRVELKTPLPADARVVASGGGFLADGDLVRVVDAPGTAAAAVVPAGPVAAAVPARPAVPAKP